MMAKTTDKQKKHMVQKKTKLGQINGTMKKILTITMSILLQATRRVSKTALTKILMI
jgi:hypothetical protein